jgi:DNA-binding transcriptional MocR family regulator
VAKPGRPKVSDEDREAGVRNKLRTGGPYSSKNKLLDDMNGTRSSNAKAYEQLVARGEILATSTGLTLRSETRSENGEFEWSKS